ncbi:hypothetical protein JW710_02860 [Candidatus Dojkabacteria bacterium]|nr:hypothetical protein [Candidatus Dojkabacteria bacterium]
MAAEENGFSSRLESMKGRGDDALATLEALRGYDSSEAISMAGQILAGIEPGKITRRDGSPLSFEYKGEGERPDVHFFAPGVNTADERTGLALGGYYPIRCAECRSTTFVGVTTGYDILSRNIIVGFGPYLNKDEPVLSRRVNVDLGALFEDGVEGLEDLNSGRLLVITFSNSGEYALTSLVPNVVDIAVRVPNGFGQDERLHWVRMQSGSLSTGRDGYRRDGFGYGLRGNFVSTVGLGLHIPGPNMGEVNSKIIMVGLSFLRVRGLTGFLALEFSEMPSVTFGHRRKDDDVRDGRSKFLRVYRVSEFHVQSLTGIPFVSGNDKIQ